MQILGLSDSTAKPEGSRVKALLWPTIRHEYDADYICQQGFWVCVVIALITFGSSLFTGSVVISLIFAVYYFLGGIGVRQCSRFAAVAVFVNYVLSMLAGVDRDPGVPSIPSRFPARDCGLRVCIAPWSILDEQPVDEAQEHWRCISYNRTIMQEDSLTQLGPYVLLAPIGAGGMGEVWKARDTRLNRVVAIKRLKGRHSGRFEQEARAIAALNHPNICMLFDVGPDYLVMEYIEGKPLPGKLPPEEAVRFAIQIAAALEEAHGRGILHRDLKPGNVLITSKGSIKLLDFGLAKLLTEDDPDATRTNDGTLLGTPAYMSPEQAQGKTLDERSDVFSFGAVLYEMLSGTRAFGGDSLLETLNAVVRDEPAPLESQVTDIVKRCMSKQPAQRFQSIAEVRAVLESASQGMALRHSQQPSIAVLPFANMSGDKEQEYFSDGLAEEIINALTHVPGLKVIARTSAFAFKGQHQDIRRIAEALGVVNVLEGSVRKAGNRVRVTAQLITAADGSHLWSERYDRELTDVFAIQDEIAAAITEALRLKLAAAPGKTRRYKPSIPAYEAYLKARYYRGKLTPETMVLYRQYLDQAIALDPRFPLAHVELADAV